MPFHRVRDPERLQALIDCILLIEADADLSVVLQDIVQAAADLAGARYGALGVLDLEGEMLTEFLTVGITAAQRATIGALPKGGGILGLVTREAALIRLKDLTAHPDSVGFPPGHPPMHSFLGVPIRVRDTIFGNLYLCDKVGSTEFDEEDEDVVAALGLAAGLVIDKARLYARLRELTLSQERERLAREVHDRVIQRLFAVGLGLQAALPDAISDDLRHRLEVAVDDLDETIRQIRTTIFAADGPRLDGGPGLREGILATVDEALGGAGVDARVDIGGPVDTVVGPVAAEHVLVSLREALSGIVRDAAGASRVDVRVELAGRALVLTVVDDGNGKGAERSAHGQSVRRLEERARLLGGTCQVHERAAGGTELVWRVTALD